MSAATATAKDDLGIVPVHQAIEYFNFMVYGDPGVGKTVLASTAQDHPDTAPVLILDVEGGLASIRHRTDIDSIPIRSIKELVKVHAALEKDMRGYKTVVIDSLTELQSLDVAEIMAGPLPANQDKDVPSQREWGKTRTHMRNIVREFRDLPCHVVFTALAHYDQDSDGTNVTVPNLSGKLKGEIPGFLDVLGYLYSREEKGVMQRRLQVQPTRRTKAKDRCGVGGDSGVVINPTFPLLWNRIKEHD